MLAFSVFLAFLLYFQSSDANYPQSFAKNNKILIMITSFNFFDHIDPIVQSLNEYVAMCEGGWNPSIIFFSSIQWSAQLYRMFREKSFCYRTNKSIAIKLKVVDPNKKELLSIEHRNYVLNEFKQYDLFIYQEDDMIFKHAHLVAYLAETKILNSIENDEGSVVNQYMIGFFRYGRHVQQKDHRSHSSEQTIFEQEFIEEKPVVTPLCLKKNNHGKNNYLYMKLDGNINQGAWILTQSQIIFLHEKCNFLHQNEKFFYFLNNFRCYFIFIIFIIFIFNIHNNILLFLFIHAFLYLFLYFIYNK
jgi:hypothetical protein